MKSIILIYGIYTLLFGGMIYSVNKKQLKFRNTLPMLIIAMTVAFAVRMYYSLQFNAFWDDINCFKTWSELIHSYGFGGIYENADFLDYPPMYLYMLGFLSFVKDILHIADGTYYTFLIKLFPCIRDILTGIFIYLIAKDKTGDSMALMISVAYVFCPAVIYDSAIWGQIDGWFTLLIVLSLWLALNNLTVATAFVYGIALLTKPQALMYGPVFLWYIVLKRKNIKDFFAAVITGIATVYAFSLPFSHTLNPVWLIKLYTGTMSGYKFYSVNAYNLYSLLGLNNAAAENTTLINAAVILIAIILSALCFRMKNAEFVSAYALLIVIFTFATMMHERYLFPAILLCIFACIYSKNPVWLLLSLANGFAVYLNTRLVLITRYFEYPNSYSKIAASSAFTVFVCIVSVVFIIIMLLSPMYRENEYKIKKS